MTFSEVVKTLIRSRGGYKSRVTSTLNDFQELLDSQQLSLDLFERQQTCILKYLDKIEEVNIEIDGKCVEKEIDIDDEDRNEDIISEQRYMRDIQSKLSQISESFNEIKVHNDSVSSTIFGYSII